MPDVSLILACSPREGGNTDAAATTLAGVLSDAAPERCVGIRFLREHRVFPCLSCGACSRAAAAAGYGNDAAPGGWNPPFGCPLNEKDEAAALFQALLAAARVYVVSPIYFYHLPAGLKALLDRAQALYALGEAGNAALRAAPERPCHAILIAGRPRGRLLFQGSLLTLQYAMESLRLSLSRPLLLRGLDSPGDFAASRWAVKAVAAYARKTVPAAGA